MLLKSFQRCFYSVVVNNTSGLGLPNIQVGTLTYTNSGFPQTKFVLNYTGRQDLTPPPTLGSPINYVSTGINTNPPNASLIHSNSSFTTLAVNLSPGGTLGYANLIMYEQ
jgi:hypothetical protein